MRGCELLYVAIEGSIEDWCKINHQIGASAFRDFEQLRNIDFAQDSKISII